MAKTFYNRLKIYFESIAKNLRGEAEVASIFPNTSDIGLARELIYVKFLTQHIPSKCNIYLGGFLFGDDGEESKQLDVIISTDTAPKYNFFNVDGNGKSFGPVEGCLGAASIKSMLDKEQLIDSLKGIASIPPTLPLEKRINPMARFEFDYNDWPYKIIYASSGLSAETILKHINDFFILNPDIPITRRPDIIHVAGKYAIFRIKKGILVKNIDGTDFNNEGEFYIVNRNSDIRALTWALDELQKKATIASHILFNYSEILNKIDC